MPTPAPKRTKVESNPEEADVEEGAVFLLEALNNGLTAKLEEAGIDPEGFVKFNDGTVSAGHICGKSGCKWNRCEFRKRRGYARGSLVAHVEEHLKITTVPPKESVR